MTAPDPVQRAMLDEGLIVEDGPPLIHADCAGSARWCCWVAVLALVLVVIATLSKMIGD